MFVKHGDGKIVSVFEIDEEETLDEQKKKFRRQGTKPDEQDESIEDINLGDN